MAAVQGSHSLSLGLQAERRRIDTVVTQHETLEVKLKYSWFLEVKQVFLVELLEFRV